MSFKFRGELDKLHRQMGDSMQRIAALEAENDKLKEIVHNTLVKNNADYRRRFVLSEMGEFLNRKLANG